MTFYDFLSQIAGPYTPVILEDGSAVINWQCVASYAVVFAVIWWILHMVNNMFFGKRR